MTDGAVLNDCAYMYEPVVCEWLFYNSKTQQCSSLCCSPGQLAGEHSTLADSGITSDVFSLHACAHVNSIVFLCTLSAVLWGAIRGVQE